MQCLKQKIPEIKQSRLDIAELKISELDGIVTKIKYRENKD